MSHYRRFTCAHALVSPAAGPFSHHLDLSHVHYTANASPVVHVVESLVDSTQILSVGDKSVQALAPVSSLIQRSMNLLVDLELSVCVIRDEIRQLGAALDTAECTAFPSAAGNELEC